MNSHAPQKYREKRRSVLVGLAALLALACGPGPGEAKAPASEAGRTFVFAPRVGLVFKHQMKHLEEFIVAGSTFRDSVEWRVVWEVKVEEQADKYLYRRRLVEFGIALNGAPVLAGNEVESKRAEVVQVMSRDGHALDVTGTEQLTDALASLVPEANRAAVAEVFSPENLRAILLARAVDAFDEVVGKPAELGSSWTAAGNFGPLIAKTVVVDSELGCGGRSCRRLVRTFDVDQQLIGDAVRQKVARFVTEQGWDPTAVRVVESKVKVEDSFVVEPDTCHFHDALLSEQGNFVLEGPNGGRIEVVLTSKHESHSEYPPPQ